MNLEIERFVRELGENKRKLIENSLKWLEEKEKEWCISINHEGFIKI